MLKLTNFDMAGPTTITFELYDDVVVKTVTLQRLGSKWAAHMSLTQTKECSSVEEAVKSLGETLVRISDIIFEEQGNFGTIDLSKLLT
jgi:hypothetical protein